MMREGCVWGKTMRRGEGKEEGNEGEGMRLTRRVGRGNSKGKGRGGEGQWEDGMSMSMRKR